MARLFKPISQKELNERCFGSKENYDCFIFQHSLRPWVHDAAAFKELIKQLEEFLKYVKKLYRDQGPFGGMEYGEHKDIAIRIEWFFKRYGAKDASIKELVKIAAAVGKEKATKPTMAEIEKLVKRVKELCRNLRAQIKQEAVAFK